MDMNVARDAVFSHQLSELVKRLRMRAQRAEDPDIACPESAAAEAYGLKYAAIEIEKVVALVAGL